MISQADGTAIRNDYLTNTVSISVGAVISGPGPNPELSSFGIATAHRDGDGVGALVFNKNPNVPVAARLITSAEVNRQVVWILLTNGTIVSYDFRTGGPTAPAVIAVTYDVFPTIASATSWDLVEKHPSAPNDVILTVSGANSSDIYVFNLTNTAAPVLLKTIIGLVPDPTNTTLAAKRSISPDGKTLVSILYDTTTSATLPIVTAMNIAGATPTLISTYTVPSYSGSTLSSATTSKWDTAHSCWVLGTNERGLVMLDLGIPAAPSLAGAYGVPGATAMNAIPTFDFSSTEILGVYNSPSNSYMLRLFPTYEASPIAPPAEPPVNPPVAPPAAPPVAAPIAAPVASPVAMPTAPPVSAPTASPVASPIASPAAPPVAATPEQQPVAAPITAPSVQPPQAAPTQAPVASLIAVPSTTLSTAPQAQVGPNSDAANNSTSGALSAGVIVGIVIACLLGLVVVGVILFVLLKRKRSPEPSATGSRTASATVPSGGGAAAATRAGAVVAEESDGEDSEEDDAESDEDEDDSDEESDEDQENSSQEDSEEASDEDEDEDDDDASDEDDSESEQS
jgi:hypothetical protein